jgi:hypothetical protein
MSLHAHPHDHGRHDGQVHAHDHAHGDDHHHGHAHAHAPAAPHPPMVMPPSFMRLSIGARLGIAMLASAVLWCAIWLAMR